MRWFCDLKSGFSLNHYWALVSLSLKWELSTSETATFNRERLLYDQNPAATMTSTVSWCRDAYRPQVHCWPLASLQAQCALCTLLGGGLPTSPPQDCSYRKMYSLPTAHCPLFHSEATGPKWAQMQKQTLASANIQANSEVRQVWTRELLPHLGTQEGIFWVLTCPTHLWLQVRKPFKNRANEKHLNE